LATLLGDSGVDVQPDELVPRVWIPARRGALQAEMLAAGREYGRIPYVLPPELPALLTEVAAGRPVLVLQNLGVSLLPMWHYAVVVGFSPETSEIILRSGTEERLVTSARVFARTWRRSDNWAAVLLHPRELPANDDVRGYLRAVAAVESAGYPELAEAAYASAVKRWPDSHLAWFGRGNAAWRLGDARQAERMYREALGRSPGNVVTLNNLATAIAHQGRCDEARALLQEAMAAAQDSEMIEVLAQSNAEFAGC
jgi:tetratricopeptide (TPR) repeat protein